MFTVDDDGTGFDQATTPWLGRRQSIRRILISVSGRVAGAIRMRTRRSGRLFARPGAGCCGSRRIVMTALHDGSDLRACVRAYRRHDLLNQAGKACWSRTAISFSTSGTGSGWSMLKRKAPDEVAYPVSSSLSCGKTEPLWGR